MWQHPCSVTSWKGIVKTIVKMIQILGFEDRLQQFSRCKHVTAHRLMKACHVKIFKMPATLNDHILSDINRYIDTDWLSQSSFFYELSKFSSCRKELIY